jgi:hypothetical protein
MLVPSATPVEPTKSSQSSVICHLSFSFVFCLMDFCNYSFAFISHKRNNTKNAWKVKITQTPAVAFRVSASTEMLSLFSSSFRTFQNDSLKEGKSSGIWAEKIGTVSSYVERQQAKTFNSRHKHVKERSRERREPVNGFRLS